MPKRSVARPKPTRKRARPRLVTKAHQLERDEHKAVFTTRQRLTRKTNG